MVTPSFMKAVQRQRDLKYTEKEVRALLLRAVGLALEKSQEFGTVHVSYDDIVDHVFNEAKAKE